MSELRKTLTEICSIAVIDQESIPLHTNGIIRIERAAIAVIAYKACACG
jgi:hypothetical protein